MNVLSALWRLARLPRHSACRLVQATSVFVAFSIASLSAQTAATGGLSGQVLDASTGKYLEGADVLVQGTDLRTVTSRSGSFTFPSVPVGAQNVVVSYLGLDAQTLPVTIIARQTTPLTVRLTSDVVQLGAFTVTSMRQGMAQAVALQKISVQSKVVAAADQFGPVSEGNIGEYLKFLPGVTIDYNVNDARGISLRGLSTAFTIVAVDGTPMAGTSSIDDTRRFEFEQIAMNNVETTELFKSVTPDIPASATGGFVNFVTKSAFDHEETQLITYDLSLSAPSTNLSWSKRGGVWGHSKEWTARPSLELNVARKINEKLGVNVNYRLSEKYDDSPRVEYTWNQAAPTATVPSLNTNPRLQQFNIRSEEKLTHRESFATKIDYRISDSTRLFITGQWNWYDLNFTQRGPFLILGSASVRNADDSFTSGTGSSISNQTLYRNKYGTTIHFNGTFSHDFENGSKIEITPYWSRANGQYRDVSKGFISTTATLASSATTFTSFSLADVFHPGNNPGLSIKKGTEDVPVDYIRNLGIYTLSNTTGTNLQSRPWTAIDEKNGVNGHYAFDLKNAKLPAKFDVGFALDSTDRLIDRPDLRYSLTPAVTGGVLSALVDPLYTRDVAFGFGPFQSIDPFKSLAVVANNPVVLSTYDKRQISEDNTAIYARTDVNVTPDLLFTGGVRWEKRDISARARTGAAARNLETTSNLGYDHYYPSAQFKYTPKALRALVSRASFSRTIGHPDYGDFLPVITAPTTPGGNDGSLTVPAKNLGPYFTNNYDLTFDYYLKNSGVIGLSFFHKDVSNFIVSRTMTAEERSLYLNAYGLTAGDYGANTTGIVKENGAKTKLEGFEVSYAQNLTFLPSPFNGFNLQANFTYIDIDASDADRFKAIDAEYAQSRAVSPKTANFILGYRFKKFSVTSTTNWVSASLFGGFVATSAILAPAGSTNTANPGADTRLALYRDEKATTDIRLQYEITKHATVYFLVRNVFNSRRNDYAQGYLPENQRIRLPYRTYEFGEPHLTLGVKGTF